MNQILMNINIEEESTRTIVKIKPVSILVLIVISMLLLYTVYHLLKQLFSRRNTQSAVLISKTTDNYVTQQIFLHGRTVEDTHVQIGTNYVLHYDLEDGTR